MTNKKKALAALMVSAMLDVHPSSLKIAVAIRKCRKKTENKLEISDLKPKNL